jgi:NitT/TauT family transport system permease protein
LGAVFFLVSGLRLGSVGRMRERTVRAPSRAADILWFSVLALVVLWAAFRIVTFFMNAHLGFGDVGTAVLLGVFTMIRVVVLMALATLVWVPAGVWIGLRPKRARAMGAAAQFLAAFPANLFYPIFVVVIVRYSLNPNIWLTPLIVLGTQWYIAFNVIAGAAAFPGDLQEAAKNFRVGGLLWWRRVILPGIFPYFVTGAITASGGSWNASLVAEVATWGNTTLHAEGLGAYIQEATVRGDTPRVLLGMVVMAGFVLTFNRVVWRPMYAYSSKRLRY